MLSASAWACGFQGVPQNNDGMNGGGNDFSSGGGGNDFAMSMMGGNGAGPEGALQTGFCCTKDQDCAGRRCLTGNGFQYCSMWCQQDGDCQYYSTAFTCDQNASQCVATAALTACLDPSTYHYGSHGIGSCCAAGPNADQYCQGGLCISSGNPNNPLYCSQGCDSQTPCPGGYTCLSRNNGFLTDLRQCFMDPTAQDNNATISCK